LFAPTLLAIAQVLDPPEALFKQWLASLLLGALNIEQTKFLNWEDLSRLLGAVVRFPHPQRQQLERVAQPASVQALARFNARQLLCGGGALPPSAGVAGAESTDLGGGPGHFWQRSLRESADQSGPASDHLGEGI